LKQPLSHRWFFESRRTVLKKGFRDDLATIDFDTKNGVQQVHSRGSFLHDSTFRLFSPVSKPAEYVIPERLADGMRGQRPRGLL
jgi:hypothetical protein